MNQTKPGRSSLMRVEFFEGRIRYKAAGANTDGLCAVAVKCLCDGAAMEVDRRTASLGVTDAVVMAVAERWTKELPSLTRRPREMYCSGAHGEGWPHTALFVTCGFGMLAGWKKFLGELLSRAESWRPRGIVPDDQKLARHLCLARNLQSSIHRVG
jgi:hypothetical protein